MLPAPDQCFTEGILDDTADGELRDDYDDLPKLRYIRSSE